LLDGIHNKKNKQMKKLTLEDVELAVWFLIKRDEETTTLDVKRLLREQDFFATQAEVSYFMKELENISDELCSESNGQYLIYKFDFDSYNELSDECEDDEDDTQGYDVDDTFHLDVELKSIRKDKVQPIYSTSNYENIPFKQEDNEWIVFDKYNNTFHKYESTLTRDTVRSRFASIEKIKIQDVRARRTRNMELI
jgi:hypothetical protein